MEKTIQRPSISAPAALKLVQAAAAKAEMLNLAVSVSVVDEGGNLKAFSRMDGAPLVSISASRSKALTAVGFGLKTGNDWYQFIKDDPILMHGAPALENFMLLGGGIPLLVEGIVVGAVGVSGGHYQMDEACAEAAAEAFRTM